MAENLLGGKYHVFLKVCPLADLAIHLCDDLEGRAVGKEFRAEQRGTDRRKLVESLGEEKLTRLVLGKLKHAAGHIIADGVTQNVSFGVFG